MTNPTRRALCAALCLTLIVAGSSAQPPAPKVTVEEARYAALDKAVTDQKGNVVLVDFWATWCPPCVKKMPAVVALHQTYRAKGLAVVTVSLDKNRRGYSVEAVQKFLAGQNATCTNFVAADAATDGRDIVKRFGIGAGIPYLTLFDKTGKRVWDSDAKPLSEKELAALIETELAK